MEIISENAKNLTKVVEALKEGKLTFMATETVYIAAVDATNPEAVKKLVAFKNRPFGKPFSIAVTDIKMAEEYVELNETARDLYKKFLPGPVTVVSMGTHKVAPGVEAENGTLGIRIPDYKFVLDVVARLDKPITATSANASYQKRPYKLDDILENISDKQKGLIDLMVDAGTLPEREPSTVIDTTLEDATVLRQGDVKLKDQIEILSRSEENTQNIGKELVQKYDKYLGKRPLIFALEGPMGAGKTQMTKGMGKALGIKDEILSPTFNLVLEYKAGEKSLSHFDAWRFQDASELDALGLTQMLEDKNMVVAIEWADKVLSAIKKHREEAIIVWVKISYGKNENERLVSWGNL